MVIRSEERALFPHALIHSRALDNVSEARRLHFNEAVASTLAGAAVGFRQAPIAECWAMDRDGDLPSRVTRTKAEANANYDRLSRWYDLLAWSERKAVRAGLEVLDAQPGETVLEIGFGTGRSLVTLAHAVGPTGHIYGIDISEGMLQVTSRRLRRAGLSDRVTPICGDAVVLPYEDETFDGILMAFTLELFVTPEIAIVLQECRRVLRPGGRIAVVAMQKQSPPTLAQRFYEWVHRVFPRLVDCRPIDAESVVSETGFQVSRSSKMRLWNLPVSIALAEKV